MKLQTYVERKFGFFDKLSFLMNIFETKFFIFVKFEFQYI